MTVSELKANYIKNNPEGHFFDRDTLKFFGETLSTMYVLSKTEIIKDSYGVPHKCYVLSSLQRKHPGGARRAYHYFDYKTFNNVIGEI